MQAMRSMRAALALAVLASMTGCARPDAPVASPRAPVAVVDVAPSTTATAAHVPPSVVVPVASTPRKLVTGGSARADNQRALAAAAVPFATYLNAMHNRMHGLFTDDSLAKLDSLPPNDPLNDKKLMTKLELVIDGKTGNLVKPSVIKPSGLTAFDALALDAVTRAAPFEPAAGTLWSSDGNVYVHWEFWREPAFACSTMHARPFLLDMGSAPQ